MSRIGNSIKNIKYNIGVDILNILVSFCSRRVFVHVLSSEYLGLNGVFSNILSMLSLAELGISSAICFALYSPIFKKDEEKINSLMYFYKKAYNLIGLFVLAIGVLLIPFLDLLVEDLPNMPYIRVYYFLFVSNSALSYFFVYKKTLFVADQKQYITKLFHQAFVIIMRVTQIILLLITHNYFSYLIVMIASTVLENLSVSWFVNKSYPFLDLKKAKPLDKKEKKDIFKNVLALTSHRIGGVIVNSTDNIIMVKFVGVSVVGLYSNYVLLKDTILAFIVTIFQALTSSVGNLGAETTDTKKKEDVFNTINFVGAWLVGFCSVCLFVLYNPFIELWLGSEYLFDMRIVTIIVVNFYILGMRQAVMTVRNAFGIFWYDRFNPLIEGAINLVASIILTMNYGIEGILWGTFISTVLTSFWVEPYVLYKHGFNKKCTTYFIKYLGYLTVTVLSGIVCWNISNSIIIFPDIINFIIKVFSCVVITNIIFLIAYFRTKPFKSLLTLLKRLIQGRRFKCLKIKH